MFRSFPNTPGYIKMIPNHEKYSCGELWCFPGAITLKYQELTRKHKLDPGPSDDFQNGIFVVLLFKTSKRRTGEDFLITKLLVFYTITTLSDFQIHF